MIESLKWPTPMKKHSSYANWTTLSQRLVLKTNDSICGWQASVREQRRPHQVRQLRHHQLTSTPEADDVISMTSPVAMSHKAGVDCARSGGPFCTSGPTRSYSTHCCAYVVTGGGWFPHAPGDGPSANLGLFRAGNPRRRRFAGVLEHSAGHGGAWLPKIGTDT